MSDKKEIFIGQSLVKQVAENKETDLVGVLYESGKSEDFTVEQWEAVKSDKKYSDGEINIRKYEKLIQRILKEMVDARVSLLNHGFVLQKVDATIGMNYKKCLAKVFSKNKMEDLMLCEIDAILKAEK